MKKPVILVTEGDKTLRQQLKSYLLRHGFSISRASDSASLDQTAQIDRPSLVILFACCTDSGEVFERVRRIRRWTPGIPIILIASKSSEDLLIGALRQRVNDYFKTPLSMEELVVSVRRCLLDVHPCSFHALTSPPFQPCNLPELIGDSQPMRQLGAYLLKVASVDTNVLITGETGTGKELAALIIHRNSARQGRPFLSVNCAAIPDSLLESELFGHEKGAFTGAHCSYAGKLKGAEGGTVLLDEIGDMSAYGQAKVLRVLENKEVHRLGGDGSTPVDVRFIGATNQDLEHLVAGNKFRKDLYYRLNVARIHLPPLRERKEDLPQLFDHYLRHGNRRYGQEVEGFTEDTMDCLLGYDWPGNVRELKNLLEAVFINRPSRRITLTDLPDYFLRQARFDKDSALAERERLLATLSSTNWNKSRAAEKLNWSRMTLYRKMVKYEIRKSKPQRLAENLAEQKV